MYACGLAEESVLADGLPEIPLSWVHIPFAQKMRFAEGSLARMLRPQELPFNYSTASILQMNEAVIWHLTYHDNFGHLLGEHGPTLHNALCTHLGRCASSSQKTQRFFINDPAEFATAEYKLARFQKGTKQTSKVKEHQSSRCSHFGAVESAALLQFCLQVHVLKQRQGCAHGATAQ